MTGRPRIALVAASLDILGGQGVQARALVDALRADGYPVAFVPINPRFPRGLRWVRRIPYARTLLNQLLYLPSLLRLARADVVHVFSASFWSFLLAPAPAMLAARLFRTRVVLHYHSGEAAEHLSGGACSCTRGSGWRRHRRAVGLFEGHLRRARHAARVILNVVDLSRFAWRERSPLQPRLISTRNLEPYYRVDVVLDAFRRLRAAIPEATLTVAGYGSEEARLRGDGRGGRAVRRQSRSRGDAGDA
jgi:glycosyltransferase involved in cell wall biosynthesis